MGYSSMPIVGLGFGFTLWFFLIALRQKSVFPTPESPKTAMLIILSENEA